MFFFSIRKLTFCRTLLTFHFKGPRKPWRRQAYYEDEEVDSGMSLEIDTTTNANKKKKRTVKQAAKSVSFDLKADSKKDMDEPLPKIKSSK